MQAAACFVPIVVDHEAALWIACGVVLIAASFLFLALEDALKVIWAEPVRPGFRNSIKRRALAVLVALLAGLVLIGGIQAIARVTSRIVPMMATVLPVSAPGS